MSRKVKELSTLFLQFDFFFHIYIRIIKFLSNSCLCLGNSITLKLFQVFICRTVIIHSVSQSSTKISADGRYFTDDHDRSIFIASNDTIFK